MRPLLLATLLSLPTFAQVWMTDGTQIRTQHPASSPQPSGLVDRLAALANPGLYTPSSRPFQPPFPGLSPSDLAPQSEYLERLDPQGRSTALRPPPFLDLLRVSYWEGAAYALGHRQHPAASRAFTQSPEIRPTEVWISRDFKTWQPFAHVDEEAPYWRSSRWIQGLLPLAQDRFLCSLSEDFSHRGFRMSRGMAVFHRQADGQMVWERDVPCSPMSMIRRGPKGLVILDYVWRVGRYQVLDNRDAHLLREGKLEVPAEEEIQLLDALVRPDGNLLIIAGRDPWESSNAPSSTASSPSQVTPSSYMVMSLLNHRYQREKRDHPDATQFRWYVLDPATGGQSRVAPPAGFPRELSAHMRALQFRDSEHLEW